MIGEKEKARRMTALFFLGAILFGYPFISLFNNRLFFFGIPLLYFYVFFIWLLFIILIALASRTSSRTTDSRFYG